MSHSDRSPLIPTPFANSMGVNSKAGFELQRCDSVDETQINVHTLHPHPEGDDSAEKRERLSPRAVMDRVPSHIGNVMCGVKQTLLLVSVFAFLACASVVASVFLHWHFSSSLSPQQLQQLEEQIEARITKKLEQKFEQQWNSKFAELEAKCIPAQAALPDLVKDDGDDNNDYEDANDIEPSHWREDAVAPSGKLSSALDRWAQPHDSQGEENEDPGYPDHAYRRKREARNGAEDKKRHKRQKGKPENNGGGKCKQVHKCIADQKGSKKLNKKCQKIVDCVPEPAFVPNPEPSFVPKAVHFMSDFWKSDHIRQINFGKERRSMETKNGEEQALNFLDPAPWMKSVYKDPSEQPIKAENNGYVVKQSGLYLIYSSVMFHDIKPRQSQAVVVNGHKLFKCMDSVDYIDKDLPTTNNQAKYKTCAMTGVTHLNKNDRLEVQNLYANTEIDLSTDATYFGAVLLSPGETMHVA